MSQSISIKKTFIPVLRGIDMSQRSIPLIDIKARQAGPTIFVTAAIHGNEVTGTAIIHSLMSKLGRFPLVRGRLLMVPILNPSAFEMNLRQEPFEEEDVNRQFPGDPNGSPSERFAFMILKMIKEAKPDCVIDLHTDSMNSIAYSMIDPVSRDKTTTQKTVTLAQVVGFPWVVDVARVGYNPETTLTGSLNLLGIPAVTIELGGPMVVMEEFRRAGLDAVWRTLKYYGIVKDRAETVIEPKLPSMGLVFEEKVVGNETGIIDYRVKPGEWFSKGQILGKIRNVFGKEIEVLTAPVNGLLLSHEDQSITFPGMNLFTFAKESNLTDYLNI